MRVLVLALIGLCAACQSRATPGPAATEGSTKPTGTSASPVASVSGSSSSMAPEAGRDPLVKELCTALHALPELRRAQCCQQPPSLELTEECRRGLDASLGLKAVVLDAGEVHACVAALTHAYEGCAQVGPNHPATPVSCVGVVHGVLPAKSKCRSSLECLEGLRCHGIGPTTAGVCDVPHAAGTGCGSSMDVLATYSGQKDLAHEHPECAGACDGLKCVAAAATAGKKAAPIGQACPYGLCEEGARCISGRCVAPRTAGEGCDVDRECLGGCVKAPGEKSGKCGMRCDLP